MPTHEHMLPHMYAHVRIHVHHNMYAGLSVGVQMHVQYMCYTTCIHVQRYLVHIHNITCVCKYVHIPACTHLQNSNCMSVTHVNSFHININIVVHT